MIASIILILLLLIILLCKIRVPAFRVRVRKSNHNSIYKQEVLCISLNNIRPGNGYSILRGGRYPGHASIIFSLSVNLCSGV